MATIAFLIFTSVVGGLMAAYFHFKNEKADRDGTLLENTPGFRYTT
jgi:hypothetical protein